MVRRASMAIAPVLAAAGLLFGWSSTAWAATDRETGPVYLAAPPDSSTDDAPEALPDLTPQMMEGCRETYRGCDCLEPMFRGITAHPDVRAFLRDAALEDLYPQDGWTGAAGSFLTDMPSDIMMKMYQGMRDLDRGAVLDCVFGLESLDPEDPTPAEIIRDLFGPGILPNRF